MKKVLLFVAVISAFSFASCKKDRTCTCSITYPNGGLTGTEITTDHSVTKSTEKKRCVNKDIKDASGAITASYTCTIN